MLAHMIVGHFVGDYLLQNHWMATNKKTNSWACFVHCVLYTFAVSASTLFTLPSWAVAFVFLAHYPIDRTNFVRRFMHFNKQDGFVESMGPWAIVIVDNTMHLVVLWLVAVVLNLP